MREVGISEDKLEYLAAKATEWGDTGTMCPINKDDRGLYNGVVITTLLSCATTCRFWNFLQVSN